MAPGIFPGAFLFAVSGYSVGGFGLVGMQEPQLAGDSGRSLADGTLSRLQAGSHA